MARAFFVQVLFCLIGASLSAQIDSLVPKKMELDTVVHQKMAFDTVEAKIKILTQEASFSNLKVLTDTWYEEVQGVMITFDVDFRYSPYELYPDSNHANLRYKARLEIFDAEGKKMAAVPDASGYTVVNLEIKIQQYVVLNKGQHKRSKKQFFIPYYALNLPEGKHLLNLSLSLRDEQTEKWLIENQIAEGVIRKPRSTLIKIKLKNIEVAETDKNNETWDFSVLSKREELPDIKWRLDRGGISQYNSRKQNNTFVYKGNTYDETDYLTVSKGDKLFLAVKDYDLLSFSDDIGTLFFDPNDSTFLAGGEKTFSFGKVIKLVLEAEVIDAPGVKIGGLKIEGYKVENGETGAVLSFNYQKFGAHESQSSRLRVYANNDEELLVKNAKMLVGGMEQEDPGIFVFGKDDLGNVSIFIPNYELLSINQGNPLEVDMRVWTRFRNLMYNSSNLVAQLKPIEVELKDLRFKKISIEEATELGTQGVKMSFSWSLPVGYHTELKDALFPIKIKINHDEERILPTQRRLIEKGGMSFEGDQVKIIPDKTGGKVVQFIPWYSLNLSPGAHVFDISVEGKLDAPSFSMNLGSFFHSDTLVSPALKAFSFKVSEISVKKPNPDVDYRWRVSLGGKLLYTAEKGKGLGNVQWPAAHVVRGKAVNGDNLRIEVFKSGIANETKVLAAWDISIDKLEVLKDKKIKLKADEVRKLIIVPQ